MLTQSDIDGLMDLIQYDSPAYIYYIAHMSEVRQTSSTDKCVYKDISDFKVIKVRVSDIQNAYFEYLNYLNNPDDYHTESEECYYAPDSKYMHYYITKNLDDNYNLDINPRIPSIIYGCKRLIYTINGYTNEVTDPSPIKPIYTNSLEYSNKTKEQVNSDFDNNKLNWKYIKLNSPESVDGVDFNFVTSDWYILTLQNFPTIEKPLININRCNEYFINIDDAFRYIEQLKA